MKFVSNVQFAQPNGTARLTFHTDSSSPKAWNDLCKLLGIDEGGKSHIIMPAGTWYRMRCSLISILRMASISASTDDLRAEAPPALRALVLVSE